MIYRVIIGFDTSGKPIYYKWHCNCDKCLTTGGQCSEVAQANFDEDKEKPQDTVLYASLRR